MGLLEASQDTIQSCNEKRYQAREKGYHDKNIQVLGCTVGAQQDAILGFTKVEEFRGLFTFLSLFVDFEAINHPMHLKKFYMKLDIFGRVKEQNYFFLLIHLQKEYKQSNLFSAGITQ